MDIVTRVKGILISPRTEWPVIAAEPATVGSLFTGYAMILAAIPAIAGLIGATVVGFEVDGRTFTLPFGTTLFQAVVQYVLSLVGVWLLGMVIDLLAPSFGGTRDAVAAMKVAIYGATAFWLAGIFGIIPALAVLAILGLYSFYLFYTGLPVLMRCPPDRALVYTAAVAVCGLVIGMVIGGISTFIMVRQYDLQPPL